MSSELHAQADVPAALSPVSCTPEKDIFAKLPLEEPALSPRSLVGCHGGPQGATGHHELGTREVQHHSIPAPELPQDAVDFVAKRQVEDHVPRVRLDGEVRVRSHSRSIGAHRWAGPWVVVVASAPSPSGRRPPLRRGGDQTNASQNGSH